MQVLWSLNPILKNTRIFVRNSAKIGLDLKVYVLLSLQLSRSSIPWYQRGLKDVVVNFFCIKVSSSTITVQHCVVTLQTMQSYVITQTVELVESSEKDLIPKESTVFRGKGLAKASTLHQIPPSRMTMQLAIDLVPISQIGIFVTMQFFYVTLPPERNMAFDTILNTYPHPHLAMTHSMGKARVLWGRVN